MLPCRMCDDLEDLEETKKKVDIEIAKLRSLDSETFGMLNGIISCSGDL